MSTIRIRVVALAFASVCALTACSGGGEQTTPAPADPQPTATSTDQAPAPEQSGTPPQGGQGRMPGASGLIADDVAATVGFELALGSNPEFTGSVAAASARAVARMAQDGIRGAITIFDVPPAKLSPIDPVELRKHLL